MTFKIVLVAKTTGFKTEIKKNPRELWFAKTAPRTWKTVRGAEKWLATSGHLENWTATVVEC